MVKIDNSELLKCFVITEVVLVLIPMSLFGFMMGLASSVLGFDLELLNICCISFFYTLYFFPSNLIASRLFNESSAGGIPEYFAGWMITIIMYSCFAFLIALILSLYTPLKKNRKSSKNTMNR